MINLKRKHYILGGILLVLILTNPSRREFASYCHQPETTLTGGRDYNGFLFSIYSTGRWVDGNFDRNKIWIGILGNFIKIYSSKPLIIEPIAQ